MSAHRYQVWNGSGVGASSLPPLCDWGVISVACGCPSALSFCKQKAQAQLCTGSRRGAWRRLFWKPGLFWHSSLTPHSLEPSNSWCSGSSARLTRVSLLNIHCHPPCLALGHGWFCAGLRLARHLLCLGWPGICKKMLPFCFMHRPVSSTPCKQGKIQKQVSGQGSNWPL